MTHLRPGNVVQTVKVSAITMFCTLVHDSWYLKQFTYNIHATCNNKHGFREKYFIIQYLHVCVYCKTKHGNKLLLI